MGDKPDLDPEINRDFFESNLLKVDPGMKCFERFFKLQRRKVVLCSSDAVSCNAIDLLKDTFTNLGPRLLSQQVEIHEDFISSCRDYFKEKCGGKVGVRSRMEVEALPLCQVCVLRPLRVRSGVPGGAQLHPALPTDD